MFDKLVSIKPNEGDLIVILKKTGNVIFAFSVTPWAGDGTTLYIGGEYLEATGMELSDMQDVLDIIWEDDIYKALWMDA